MDLVSNDVDVFLIMDDSFDGDTLQGEAALLFDHGAADVHFGASVFWVRRLAAFRGEQATVEFWQAKRGGGRRGIIEIVEETECSWKSESTSVCCHRK